jgi:protein-S-isoprenylcysteine O-methyltransferase Ste14
MRDMYSLLFCTLGFACLFLFDLFQIQHRKSLSRICSIIGYMHIAAGIFLLIVSYKISPISSLILLLKLTGAVLFFSLLIYSVFIEIRLRSPDYRSHTRKAIDTGTYGLVRHPGFVWFVLLMLVLISIYRDPKFTYKALIITAMNFTLILIEDLLLFPKLFINYNDYKMKVPFIIPRLRSITKVLGGVYEETD